MRPDAGGQPIRAAAEQWARTWVEIDPAALRRNADRIATRLPEGTRLILSAKKDAYGHGLITLARTFARDPRLGPLGLATIEEVIAAREQGISSDLMLFAPLHGEALHEAVRQGAVLTITDATEAQAAADAAQAAGTTARAHFKLDTGMGRIGRRPEEVAGIGAALRELNSLRIEAIYTHLADAWNDPAGARAQWEKLLALRTQEGFEALPLHIGGSDALALELKPPPGAELWVRTGIALYGDHPAIPELEPVMTFKSRIIYRRWVPGGTAISYGGLYVTDRPSELAIVGAGYGNGYPRIVSMRGAGVLIRGWRCPILGRVCMDQIIVDVTDLPETAIGDEAVLFGRQEGSEGPALLPAREVADLAETISYELFCMAGQINPRFVKDA